MEFRGIPLRTIGPGTQPEEQDGKTLSYIDMPKDMWTYTAPQMPEPGSISGQAGAREAMLWLKDALAKYGRTSDASLADLTALDNDSREIVNQILSEGEVSINYNGEVKACTQESVLAGVWRTLYFDQDEQVAYDLLEVADVPHYVRAHEGQDRVIDIELQNAPKDVTNALPILVELESHRRQYTSGQPATVINLSMLPLDDADIVFLDEQLGHGSIDILSRSYGKCQVSATRVPNIWWVRYYNSMSTLILNTLEVVDVPQVACAAPEDLRDSALRLEEMLAPYWSEVA
jgi:hydrogenase-1 operon protein HyaF